MVEIYALWQVVRLPQHFVDRSWSSQNHRVNAMTMLCLVSIVFLRCMLASCHHNEIQTESNLVEAMRLEAVEVCKSAMERFVNWEERSKHVEDHFDSVYGRAWICVMGDIEQFAFHMPATSSFVTFTLAGVQVALYRSVRRTAEDETNCELELNTRKRLCEHQMSAIENDNKNLTASLTGQIESLKQDTVRLKTMEIAAEDTMKQIANSFPQLRGDLEKLKAGRGIGMKLEHCQTAKLDKADYLVKSLEDVRLTMSHILDCNNRLAFLQSQNIEPLLPNTLTEFAYIDKSARSVNISLASRWNNDLAFLDEAAEIATEAVSKDIDLQTIAADICNSLQERYRAYTIYCFVVDRNPEYGLGFNAYLDSYATFSVQGITVTAIRAKTK